MGTVRTSGRGFSRSQIRVRFVIAAAMLLATLCARPDAYARIAAVLRKSPLNVVIIGGGPTLDHNQVAIESNVRYVARLLPPDTHRTTLFADGDINNPTVLYVDDVKALPEDEQVLYLLLHGNDRDFSAAGHYRKPSIPGSIDGASTKRNVGEMIDRITNDPLAADGGVLLYFTGHGSPLNGNLDNNHYDVWGRGGNLSVRDLAEQISHLPNEVPVTVIMAQCYSGAFGNLIFDGGDPTHSYIPRDIVGFFATTKNRMAAGCTPALNEADYHDFTSYFFAALTGQDRLGHKVTGADYNHDGHVSMDEAFCYTLAHDTSIDVPVCTSDVLLRHEIPFKEEVIVQTPYSDLKRWATKPQRAALDAISARIKLDTEDRFAQADKLMTPRVDRAAEQAARQASDAFRQLRNSKRAALLARWPELKSQGSLAYKAAYEEAQVQVAAQLKNGKFKDLIDAFDASETADEATQEEENRAAAALRFVRLSTSIVLAHQLITSGTPDQKARFTRLANSEHRTLLEATNLRDQNGVDDGFAAVNVQ